MSQRQARRICFDRILPSELHKEQPAEPVRSSPGRTRAIMPRKKWADRKILIRFLEGTPDQRRQVEDVAQRWITVAHANLELIFTDDSAAQIRVAFNPADGAWSYVGIDNLSIPKNEPTLNLGWVDQAVILHEFGHMIGLAHEHQNPEGGIQWNEAAVIADLAGPPNYWDEATTRHNVLRKYSSDQLLAGTRFDPQSIMLYAFPGDWTLNLPGGTKENTDLSPMDIEFIARMYPGAQRPEERAVDVPVWTPHVAAISRPEEEDLYRFLIADRGSYVVETRGATDVFMALLGPDNLSRLVGRDDDSGPGGNARIRAVLEPGAYFATVRHRRTTGVGPYAIQVTRVMP